MSAFVVQQSIHADDVSRHETREGAIAAIEEMINRVHDQFSAES